MCLPRLTVDPNALPAILDGSIPWCQIPAALEQCRAQGCTHASCAPAAPALEDPLLFGLDDLPAIPDLDWPAPDALFLDAPAAAPAPAQPAPAAPWQMPLFDAPVFGQLSPPAPAPAPEPFSFAAFDALALPADLAGVAPAAFDLSPPPSSPELVLKAPAPSAAARRARVSSSSSSASSSPAAISAAAARPRARDMSPAQLMRVRENNRRSAQRSRELAKQRAQEQKSRCESLGRQNKELRNAAADLRSQLAVLKAEARRVFC